MSIEPLKNFMNLPNPEFSTPYVITETRQRAFDEQDARALFSSLRMDTETVSPSLFRLLAYLGSYSETMGDEERARRYAEPIARAQRESHSPVALSPEEWELVERASTFTDIGKVGPYAERIGDAQRVVTKLYAERGKFSPSAPLAEFVRTFFPDNAEPMLRVIEQIPGLETSMPMRAFWDIHARWTYDILKTAGVAEDVLLTASAHHLLEGENAIAKDGGVPIIDLGTGRFQALGIHRPLDAREAMVILIDKYEANLTRAGATHDMAVGWLNNYLNRNAVLERLPELKKIFLECLNDLDRSRAGDLQPMEIAAK